MNDHFTTHLLWAVWSGDLISNESIFCHESHHSYLMCNKEQSKEELCLSLLNCLLFPALFFFFFKHWFLRLKLAHMMYTPSSVGAHDNIIIIILTLMHSIINM